MKTLKLLAVALLTLPLAKAQDANISDLKPNAKDEVIKVNELTKEELQVLVKYLLDKYSKPEITAPTLNLNQEILTPELEQIDIDLLERALQRDDATRGF